MATISRRTFLGRTGRAVAGAAIGGLAASAALAQAVPGAGERIRVAMIGCGGRGRYVMRGMAEKGARITHLCDLQQSRLDSTAKFLAEVQQEPPILVREMARVFDSKEVDAVAIATPDHWHALPAVRACQAGKDVYVEKPHSHSMWESRQMIAAARKYGRIMQVGTQCRSGPYSLAAREYIKSGKLGKIGIVKVFNMKSGGPFQLGDAGKAPEGFDWDAWLGPAPDRPYHQRIVNGGWLHFWDYANGDMSDDGVHQIDLALMAMGDPPPPVSVRAVGGRFVHRGDDSEQPDVQAVSWEFQDFIMTFELTGYPRYMEKTSATIRRNDLLPYWTMNATRIEIYGSEMMMTLGRHGGGWVVQQSGGGIVEKMFGRPCDEPHYENFLECIRTRKAPAADVGTAHTANILTHMGTIATRLGNRSMKFDAATGRFDSDEANRMLRRQGRKGYEIPDEV